MTGAINVEWGREVHTKKLAQYRKEQQASKNGPHLSLLATSLQDPLRAAEINREPAGIGEPSPRFTKKSMEGRLRLIDRASEPG